MSGGKRDSDDGSSIAKASEKRTKTDPNEGDKDKEQDLKNMTTFPLQTKPSSM